jgi:hypothetical protein
MGALSKVNVTLSECNDSDSCFGFLPVDAIVFPGDNGGWAQRATFAKSVNFMFEAPRDHIADLAKCLLRLFHRLPGAARPAFSR